VLNIRSTALRTSLLCAHLRPSNIDASAGAVKDFSYQTLKSWSRPRRVVDKAEYLAKGENPRFAVTPLSSDEFDAKTLYEEQYGRLQKKCRIIFFPGCGTKNARNDRKYLQFKEVFDSL